MVVYLDLFSLSSQYSKISLENLGGKGIGKLALLSCAKKISIITKTSKTDYVGGIIDNNKLDPMNWKSPHQSL
jgi:hypothetical protein